MVTQTHLRKDLRNSSGLRSARFSAVCGLYTDHNVGVTKQEIAK